MRTIYFLIVFLLITGCETSQVSKTNTKEFDSDAFWAKLNELSAQRAEANLLKLLDKQLEELSTRPGAAEAYNKMLQEMLDEMAAEERDRLIQARHNELIREHREEEEQEQKHHDELMREIRRFRWGW